MGILENSPYRPRDFGANTLVTRERRPARCDARFDEIFATVCHYSAASVCDRIHLITLAVEDADQYCVTTAVEQLELLFERLRYFSKGSPSHPYEKARVQLLRAWRYIMRGEYSRACAFLRTAAACCVGSA
jgi:hypothetical protein